MQMRTVRLLIGFGLGLALGMGGGLYYLFELDEARRFHNQMEHPPAVFEFENQYDEREACDYGYENDCPPPWAAFPNPHADEGTPDELLVCPDEDETCID
jgi:hypothetical protein